MYKTIIKNYIKKLNLNDVINFSLKNDIYLNKNEALIILNYIKNDYETILYGNPNDIFNDLKNNIQPKNYNKIVSLYYEFKNKYKNYL